MKLCGRVLLKKNKAFFFDRDGILNKSIIKNNKPYSPIFPRELNLNRDLLSFIKKLKKKGFLIIVVSNQPDIKNGKLSIYSLNLMNSIIKKFFLVDEIYICTHGKNDNCQCRKPKPGMLIEASKKWNIELSRSYIVGDRWKDIEAGKSMNCTTIFIDYNYDEPKPKNCNYIFLGISKMIKSIEKII
ncbi:HAD-IIIA family hydrolase [Candidatus Pelagibacter bacterium]|nr:HAD-IIIA family hydrolase [Candidatus Pelagibacter bacterium]